MTNQSVQIAAVALVVTMVGAGAFVIGRSKVARPAGPSAVFETKRLDLGTLKTEETAQASFPIRNDGQAPLHILGVETGCGCTVPRYPEIVASGEQGTIQVTYMPGSSGSGPAEQAVTVHTDDPAHSTVKLMISANLVPILAFSPKSPLQVSFRPGEAIHKEILLTPRADRKFEILSVSSDSSKVRATLLPPAPSDSQRVYRLELEIGESRDPGDINTHLHLKTTDPDRPDAGISLMCQAQTGPVAVPPSITVLNDPRGKAKSAGQIAVMSRGGKVKVLSTETGDPGLQARIGKIGKGQFIPITLEYTGQWKPGPKTGVIHIHTDDKIYPLLSVPFKSQGL